MIRVGKRRDQVYLLQQLYLFAHYPANAAIFPWRGSRFAYELMADLLADHVVLISEDKDGPAGFIAGRIGPSGLDPSETVLDSKFWWVNENKRGSRHGHALLDAFKKVGQNMSNVDYVVLTIEHESKVSDNTLKRLGWRPIQRSFILEV